jgi:hypothetical protein
MFFLCEILIAESSLSNYLAEIPHFRKMLRNFAKIDAVWLAKFVFTLLEIINFSLISSIEKSNVYECGKKFAKTKFLQN